MPRRAKIATMPPTVRAWLEKTLADRTHAGYHALAELLRAQHIDISHAAIHRYDQKLQRSLSAIRASTEAARLIAEAAPDELDARSAAVISLVQSHLFDAMLKLAEAEEETDPAERLKVLGQAARSIADVSRASVSNKTFARAMRDKIDAIEKDAGKRGKHLDPETLRIIREEVYGIVDAHT